MQTNVETCYQLGDWTVEPEFNRIVRGDNEVVLVPKVFALLQCLVRHQNKPVDVETIMADVWPGQIVADSSIYQAIAQLRKALGDSGKAPRYIERVSGKGYRLIMSVEPCRSKTHSGHFFKVLAIVGVLLVAWPMFLLIEGLPSSETESVQQSDRRVRTLAVANLELDVSDRDIDATKIVAFNDVLLTQLSTAEDLTVLKRPPQGPLNDADALLEGRIVKQDERVRVYLQLTHLESAQVIWAKMFDGNRHELFSLQDQVTQDLLAFFKHSESRRPISEPVVKPAFEQYLLARHFWEQRTESSLLQAKDILEAMKNEEQLFPMAAVALCETYHFLYSYSNWSFEQVLEQCEPLLERVLEARPELGQALAAQALLLTSQGEFETAETLFKKAIRLSPNYAFAHMWYGNLLRDNGQYVAALQSVRKAFQLSPMQPVINRSLAYAYLNIRDLKSARYYYRRALSIEPDYIHRAVNDLDFFALSQQRAKAFLTWANNNPLVLQRQPVYQLNRAQILLSLGENDKVRTIVERFIENGINPSFTLYVKGSLLIAQENFELAANVFESRRDLYRDSAQFDGVYILALWKSGQFARAFSEIEKSKPLALTSEYEITPKNIYTASSVAQILHAVDNQQWRSMAPEIDRVFETMDYPEDHYTAEWLAFRNQHQQAKALVEQLLNNGWIPDTNDDPFAEYRLQMAYIQSGGGLEFFKKSLRKNREWVLGAQL